MLTGINLVNQTNKFGIKKQNTNYKNTVSITSPDTTEVKTASNENIKANFMSFTGRQLMITPKVQKAPVETPAEATPAKTAFKKSTLPKATPKKTVQETFADFPKYSSKETKIESFKKLSDSAKKMEELSNEYENLLSKGYAKQGDTIQSIYEKIESNNISKKDLSLENAEDIAENVEEKEGLSAYDNVKKKFSKLDEAYNNLGENAKKSIEKDVEKLKLKLVATENEYILQRNVIAEENLKLVLSRAKSFSKLDAPFEDIVQDGTMGLIKAIDRFDVRKGNQFSTYAFPWIKQNIIDTHTKTSKNIKIPIPVNAELRKFNKTFAELTNELGRTPSREEVAEKMEISPRKLKTLTTLPSTISFETPTANSESSDGKRTIENFISDGNYSKHNGDRCMNEAEEALLGSERNELLEQLMDCLTPREKFVITQRHLIDEPLGLKAVGEGLENIGYKNISHEMVRNIERLAIQKMKKMATPMRMRLN